MKQKVFQIVLKHQQLYDIPFVQSELEQDAFTEGGPGSDPSNFGIIVRQHRCQNHHSSAPQLFKMILLHIKVYVFECKSVVLSW